MTVNLCTTVVELTIEAMEPSTRLPRVLTIAGSDSSGGAGIEADLKTFSAHGCYGLTCMTVLTAQNTEGVFDVHAVPEAFLSQALEANFDDIAIDVIKTGVLTVPAVRALKKILQKHPTPMVIDPVMVSTSGHALSETECLRFGITELFPLATIVTPNVEEAYKILAVYGEKPLEASPESVETLKDMALRISRLTGCGVVLLKGGHTPWIGSERSRYITDVLYDGEFTVYRSAYVETTNLHGTGCTLSSALCSQLALGLDIRQAIPEAIRFVHRAILSADITLGGGNGPLNHLFGNPPAPSPTPAPAPPLLFQEGTTLAFLINHPKVAPVWEKYVNHEFIRQIATRTLPETAFVYFLKQDYVYLESYARVHAMAASLAPTMEIMMTEVQAITNVEAEMQKHSSRLVRRGLSNGREEVAGPACTAYLEYFRTVAATGEWADIHVALSPCLFGYAYAARWGMLLNQDTEGEYYEWLQDYVSPGFADACAKGQRVVEGCFQTTHQIDRYVDIFAAVCQLEVDFWTEALSVGGAS